MEHLAFPASQVKMAPWVQRYSETHHPGSQVSCNMVTILTNGLSLKLPLTINECHINLVISFKVCLKCLHISGATVTVTQSYFSTTGKLQ